MRKFKNIYTIVILAIGVFSTGKAQAQIQSNSGSFIIQSPNASKAICVKLKKGELSYSVTHFKDTIIQQSPLGILCMNDNFSKGLGFVSKKINPINETYQLLIGKKSINTNRANEMIIRVKNKLNKIMDIAIRAYDDGVAFRYEFPKIEGGYTVTNELSSFSIPVKGKAWLMPYGMATDFSPAYENDYTQGSAIGQSSPDSSGWAFPALFQTQGHYILITESGLDENFYGSHLKQDCANGRYTISKPLQSEARGKYTTNAVTQQAFNTPWRTIIFGKNLGTIIESNLVYHLAPANQLKDISWIKPGRSSWSWWGDHESSKNYTSLTKFIDLSEKMSWEYSLVDANWNMMQDGGDIQDLSRYAAKKNVALTLWYNSGGEHNTVTEQPRDILNDPIKRKIEFKKISSWGVKAIKVDFFNSDKQALIQHYLAILKDAAEEKLMVIFHGCTVPRGWSRTYPNLLSMEAVKGAEQYCYDRQFYKNAPSHNITLLTGRNVVGPMDYTPVTFSNYDSVQHRSTHAHELATSILFESGVVHFADRVAAYDSLNPTIKNFLKTIPVTWDETKFMEGEPGKWMVLARKKGNDWYIAGASGELTNRAINLGLEFLPKGSYQLVLMRDGASDNSFETSTINYTTGTPLNIQMRANGGFVLCIKKPE